MSYEKCTACGGTKSAQCDRCSGTGKRPCAQCNGPDEKGVVHAGKVKCANCGGNGKMISREVLNVQWRSHPTDAVISPAKNLHSGQMPTMAGSIDAKRTTVDSGGGDPKAAGGEVKTSGANASSSPANNSSSSAAASASTSTASAALWSSTEQSIPSDVHNFVPDPLLASAPGTDIIDQDAAPRLEPRVAALHPLSHAHVVAKFTDLLAAHGAKAGSDGCRIRRQKVKVRAIPLFLVEYTVAPPLNFWVFGSDQQVHDTLYPTNCCCFSCGRIECCPAQGTPCVIL